MTERPFRIVFDERGEMLRMRERFREVPTAEIARHIVGGLGDPAQAVLGGKGLVKDTFQNFKHLRRTAHTHHPVDDATGNAEALIEMKKAGFKIAL
jgi:hypothetical protein